MKLHIVCTYYSFRVICVNNKLLAGRKCDIRVCTADIFKPRDYLVRGKSVFSYCGIILLTRPDYTFSRRATFSPDAFITNKNHLTRTRLTSQNGKTEKNQKNRKKPKKTSPKFEICGSVRFFWVATPPFFPDII